MSILLIGLNHRTAPVEVREQLAFSREGVAEILILQPNGKDAKAYQIRQVREIIQRYKLTL